MPWVMTERKSLLVDRCEKCVRCDTSAGLQERVNRVFEVGDVAPEGHQDKPYTRFEAEKE